MSNTNVSHTAAVFTEYRCITDLSSSSEPRIASIAQPHGFESKNGFRSDWRCWCLHGPARCTRLPGVITDCMAPQTATYVDDCVLNTTERSVALCARRSTTSIYATIPLATVPFRRLLHLPGTASWSQYEHRRHCQSFAVD